MVSVYSENSYTTKELKNKAVLSLKLVSYIMISGK